MKDTICQNCYFAKPIDSAKPCEFDIPDIIKQDKIIESRENYFVIKNYACRYGFSKKIYEENIDKLSNKNMIDYIKEQNIVKYSLALVLEKNANHEQIIKNINRLSIKPNYITVICYEKGNHINQLLQSYLSEQIPYKVHNFLEDIGGPQALHIAMETNKSKAGNLMWILNKDLLEDVLSNDSIQNINYAINVEQKSAHYYKYSKIESNFYGIFININNYSALSKTLDYSIENNQNILYITYD